MKIMGYLLAILAPALVSYGVYCLSMPAGFIVGGLSCVWLELRFIDKKGGPDA